MRKRLTEVESVETDSALCTPGRIDRFAQAVGMKNQVVYQPDMAMPDFIRKMRILLDIFSAGQYQEAHVASIDFILVEGQQKILITYFRPPKSERLSE